MVRNRQGHGGQPATAPYSDLDVFVAMAKAPRRAAGLLVSVVGSTFGSITVCERLVRH